MKIALVTAYFSPTPAPRAHRATELAIEFSKQGHDVTVYNTSSELNFDYKSFERTHNLKIINLNIMQINSISKNTASKFKHSLFLKGFVVFRKIVFYFTSGSWLKFSLALRSKLVFETSYDLLISVGLPFQLHAAVARISRKKKIAECLVADYGDPFSRNNINLKLAPYFQLFEKKAMKSFDFISIPTDKAKESFTWLKSESCIKVIPQGFNFDSIKVKDKILNNVPTFGYGGLFYSDIRNPVIFFDYLCSLQSDFKFVIYTNINYADSYSCIEPYIEKLGKRLSVNNQIPREKMLYELSSLDFVININNISANQIPSKLIDYALINKPVFSLTQNYFDVIRFTEFLNGDYSSYSPMDITNYNIVKIAGDFLKLVKEKQEKL